MEQGTMSSARDFLLLRKFRTGHAKDRQNLNFEMKMAWPGYVETSTGRTYNLLTQTPKEGNKKSLLCFDCSNCKI